MIYDSKLHNVIKQQLRNTKMNHYELDKRLIIGYKESRYSMNTLQGSEQALKT